MRCIKPVILKKVSDTDEAYGYNSYPCGGCLPCREEKARQWALRITHESRLSEKNCFLTLTYNDESLIYGKEFPTILKSEVSQFIKRLRRKSGLKFRFFACGEYGEKYSRPHYHIIIFGQDFRQLTDVKVNGRYLTQMEAYVEPSWFEFDDKKKPLHSKGFIDIGDCNWASASYVAKYVTKKLTGRYSQIYEEIGIMPEFSVSSNRPGIGLEYYKKHFINEISNKLPINGTVCGLPRYYKEKKFDTEEKKKKYKESIIPLIAEQNTKLIREHLRNNKAIDPIVKSLFKVPTDYEQEKYEQKLKNMRARMAQQKRKYEQ